MNRMVSLLTVLIVVALGAAAQGVPQKDIISSTKGDIEITFLGHGTLMFTLGGAVVHVDPWGRIADYAKLPKADVVLITHHHGDHLDSGAVELVTKKGTVVVGTELVAKQYHDVVVMRNGDRRSLSGIEIEAVPAYNLVQKRSNGQVFHPKGEGNGYVLAWGGRKIYIAGDTENTPEMKSMSGIDVAFLPMNLPYTMTPEMVADAVKGFRPKILYPYHFGETDVNKLVTLLKEEKGIEVRLRDMK